MEIAKPYSQKQAKLLGFYDQKRVESTASNHLKIHDFKHTNQLMTTYQAQPWREYLCTYTYPCYEMLQERPVSHD